jgi:hypothetical protein
MILSQFVRVNACQNTKYWVNKGYDIEFYTDSRGAKRVPINTYIDVKVEDLPNGSHTFIEVKCDYCGKTYTTEYKLIVKGRKEVKKDACKNCKQFKREDVMFYRYNVKYALQSDIFLNKLKATNNEKYGCDYVLSNDEVKEKIKNTNMIKYDNPYYFASDEFKNQAKDFYMEGLGVDNPMKSNDIKQKIIQTNLERYNVEWYVMTEEHKNNLIKMCQEKYDCDYFSQVSEIKNKMAKTLYKNNTRISSTQQRYLCKLFNGELNYPVQHFSIDIALLDGKFAIEYNGGGHDLQVKLGNKTIAQFNKYEYFRRNVLYDDGWKIITIASKKDELLSDECFLKLLNYSVEYINKNNRHWAEINIDDGMWRCSQKEIDFKMII